MKKSSASAFIIEQPEIPESFRSQCP
ncbi:MAG: AgrD family cyclic lactone autoinducer peptide [Chlamydiales bacterium]